MDYTPLMDHSKLFFIQDENHLRTFLGRETGRDISLVITDNSTSMLSLKARRGAVSLRLHNMFLSADINVLTEIADFIKNSRITTPLINDFIKRNRHRLKERPQRKVKIRTEGGYFNLLEIFGLINKEYFGGRISASITWGAKSPRRAAARRTLGSYSSHNNMIRINPILDNKRVPRYFLDFIVYHEMLHADIGIGTAGKRRSIHPKEFKRREREFKHYERALAWEKKRC